MTVYLLWSNMNDERFLEEIFANKIDAEKMMRQCREQDAKIKRVQHYWIQEREVQQ